MFFMSQKKARLEEEKRKQEQLRIQEEAAIQKARDERNAYAENEETFDRICDMVRSLPKKRHIVVVQRENVFKSDQDRNLAYIQLARRLHQRHLITGQRWMSAYGQNNDALYAFYEPTNLYPHFDRALVNFSKDGHRIQRIRYYSQNL